MEILCRAVFVPLAVVLLVLAFHDGARERVLNLRGIARLERRLTLSNKGYWVAFGLLLAVGAFVRCYRFLELPMGQNQDGSMAAVEALCLANNGTDQYGTSWPTYFEAWGYSQMSTLYSYLLIPFVKIFGLSKFTLRFPMLLMGLLTLPLMWDVARRIGGRGFALTALFLLRSTWLTEAFSAVLSALCQFTPFEEFVNNSFSIPTLVYYLTVTVLFLFFTAQGLEKRRWN